MGPAGRDLTPFIRELNTDDVDAVYAMLVGAHVPRFVKTYTDFATITSLVEDQGLSAGEVPQWIRDNPEDFIEAFTATEIESPHGPLKLDEYHNVVTDVHIFEVGDDGDTKEVLDTIPQVTQFGNFDPEEFLANPVFSGDFPQD